MDYRAHNVLSIQKRLLALVLAVTFIFFALLVRVAYLSLLQGDALKLKAADQWTRDLPLKASRGNIYDINGVTLARDYSSYSLYVRPRSVTNAEGLSAMLAYELNEDPAAMAELVKKRVSEVTIGRRIDKETLNRIFSHGFDGLFYSEDKTRQYTGEDMLCNVLGFTDSDGVGQAGLELYYDRMLRGTDGRAMTQTDLRGVEIEGEERLYVPSIPGLDITLTIDREIQSYAESAVKDAHAKYTSNSASMLVMDATSGAIVALATSPSFDLNTPPRDDLELLNSLLKNQLVTDVYEPGSTFKIFTLAAALEEKQTNLTEKFNDPGFRIVDGQRIKCWKTKGHGTQALGQAVNNSCNCVFMDLALRMGTEKFYDYIEGFGFGQKTGIDFFGESRGIVMNEKNVKTVDLARIGFGQAVAVTPLQMVAGACAVVNGGILYKPYFVENIKKDGVIVSAQDKTAVRRVISEETSKTMRLILEDVVATGSGKLSGVKGFRIGGKTGTAQKYKNGIISQGRYVSSFIGFMPANDPKYVALMIVDEPDGYVYYGSLVAAPYAGFVFERTTLYKKMVPDVAQLAVPVLTVRMPNLIGLPYAEAEAIIAREGFISEVAGEGDFVINQLPAPGEEIPKKSVVLISTG